MDLNNIQELQDYIADPETQKRAVAVALQLRSRFGRTWFTKLDVRKSIVEFDSVNQYMLPLLKAYGLVREQSGKYRIVLTVLEKAKAKSAE